MSYTSSDDVWTDETPVTTELVVNDRLPVGHSASGTNVPVNCRLLPYVAVRDNYNLKSHKYVCITTYQPNYKSNPNPNPNPTTKQHAIVSIQLNIDSCHNYVSR